MNLELLKKYEEKNEEGKVVALWKFQDENGNLWNTETNLEGTEEEAKHIILSSIE